MWSSDEITEVIRQHLSMHAGVPDFVNDQDLFESGIVNSLFAIQLMTFLEGCFRIEVTSQDLDLNYFRTVNQIVSFVERKRADARGSMSVSDFTL
jgi:methoxymalonate biosynthesis acyl carrier protein